MGRESEPAAARLVAAVHSAEAVSEALPILLALAEDRPIPRGIVAQLREAVGRHLPQELQARSAEMLLAVLLRCK